MVLAQKFVFQLADEFHTDLESKPTFKIQQFNYFFFGGRYFFSIDATTT
jgi:hypothetical protein